MLHFFEPKLKVGWLFSSMSLAVSTEMAGVWLVMSSALGRLLLVNKFVIISFYLNRLLTNKQEITKAYGKVIELFKNNLANSAKAPPSQQGGNLDSGSVTATTQDILILLLPHLSSSDATALFQLCLSNNVIGGKDNGVQKRGYKILSKLVESGKVTVDAEAILRQLDELSDGLAAAAKKVITTSLFSTYRF